MNFFTLALSGLSHKPLQSGLSILAVMLGMSMLTAVYLLSNGISDGLKRNSAGIDVVAGAKGSPLQLILSTIYHTDVPIGNIDMDEYEEIKNNKMVKSAIPLVMGDNYKGYRVIGTTQAYIDLYKGKITEGRIFEKPFEVVAGSQISMKLGEEFAARHGFSADSTDIHDDQLYKIVGTLKPTGTVIDKLFITPLASIQKAHSHEHEDEHHHHDHDEEDSTQQITAILIEAKNGAALMNLPRHINQDGHMQAANPSFELAKLSKNFGVGQDVLNALGLSILGLSVLMVFSTLALSLSERRYDMAVFRVLGASPFRLFLILMTQGVLIAGIGTVIGIITGHMFAYSLVELLGSFEGIIVKDAMLSLHKMDMIFLVLGCVAGMIAAFPAALSAAKIDIARLLVNR
jgi:putative ABC transport system permease protein